MSADGLRVAENVVRERAGGAWLGCPKPGEERQLEGVRAHSVGERADGSGRDSMKY